MMIEHVRRKHNIEYVPHATQWLVCGMGFSYVKTKTSKVSLK